MIRSLVALGPLGLCAFAMFACGDDGNSSGANGGGGNPDGSASTTDGATSTSVTVKLTGSGREGVEIAFQYADGTLETKRTAGDGTATSAGTTTPAMATAFLTVGDSLEPFTWMGVAAGDVLVLSTGDGTTTSTPVGTYSITAPAPTSAAVDQYRFSADSNCFANQDFVAGTQPKAFSFDVYADCLASDGKVTLLGKELEGDTIVGFAFQKKLAAPIDGSTPLTLDAWAAPTTMTLSLANATDGSVSVARLDEIVDTRSFNRQSQSVATPATTAAFPIASGFAEAYQGTVTVAGTGAGQEQLWTTRQSSSATMAFDVANTLPWIGDVTVTGKAAEPDFTWTGDTTATAGGGITFEYQPSDSGMHGSWTILVPPGTTTVHLPKVPDDAPTFRPRAQLDEYHVDRIAFFSVPGMTSTQLRTTLGALEGTTSDLATAMSDQPLATDGTIRATAYVPE